MPAAPAATCASSEPMSDPESVTTRGVFITSAATSLTAMGAASASVLGAATAPDRPQPAAPASAIGNTIKDKRLQASIRMTLFVSSFMDSFVAKGWSGSGCSRIRRYLTLSIIKRMDNIHS